MPHISNSNLLSALPLTPRVHSLVRLTSTGAPMSAPLLAASLKPFSMAEWNSGGMLLPDICGHRRA